MPEWKDGGGSTPQRVILLHGFGGLPIQLVPLSRRLKQAGFTPSTIGYPSWRWPLDRIVSHLQDRIATDDERPLHFVSHSMGGLVLRALLTRRRPASLGQVVMLGTPHGGSELADLLFNLRLNRAILNQSGDLLRVTRPPAMQAMLGTPDYPLGLIAGNRSLLPWLPDLIFRAAHDGKVSVAATQLDGATDHLVMPVAHTAMLYDSKVAKQVIHFLRTGRFERPES